MDNQYFRPEQHFLEQKKEEQTSRGMETRYDHHEREIAEDRVIGRFASFTPKLARNALEERMYDLNIRMLYVLLTKAMKEKTEILKKIQEERTTYVKAAEHLELEYKETTSTVVELQERVDVLETENTLLTESNTELKLKCEKHVEKSRMQKEIINKLEQDLENYGEIMEKHQELKNKHAKQLTVIKKLEKKTETYERKLKNFESLTIQPDTVEEFIEESLQTISRFIGMTQSTFWTEVQNYYAKLEKEFKIEIAKVKRTEEEKYNTIISEQKKESERQIANINKERRDDVEVVTTLKKEKITLQDDLANMRVEVEEFKARMQANLNKEDHVNVQLIVKREEDEGMRVQVDFYEALTKWTEEGINKMTADKNLKKVEDLERWFCQDPPEYIKQKLESIRILVGNSHSTSRMLYSTAVVNKESLDQKPEAMAYDGNDLD